MPDRRCLDLAVDRGTGKYWERQFCIMAWHRGKIFTANQWGRTSSAVAYGKGFNVLTLPDVAVWSAPGEHHEIKHKNPTRHGSYGLEEYRLNALLRFDKECMGTVFYTIHDWQRAGAKDSREKVGNRIADWVFAPVGYLKDHIDHKSRGRSYVNGESAEVLILYWQADRFYSLDALWNGGTFIGEALDKLFLTNAENSDKTS